MANMSSKEFRKKVKDSIKLRGEELKKEIELEKSYINNESKVYV